MQVSQIAIKKVIPYSFSEIIPLFFIFFLVRSPLIFHLQLTLYWILSNNAQINKKALNSPKCPVMEIWLLNSIVMLLRSNLNFFLKFEFKHTEFFSVTVDFALLKLFFACRRHGNIGPSRVLSFLSPGVTSRRGPWKREWFIGIKTLHLSPKGKTHKALWGGDGGCIVGLS